MDMRIMFSVSCAVRKITMVSGFSARMFSAARIPAVVFSISMSMSSTSKSSRAAISST